MGSVKIVSLLLFFSFIFQKLREYCIVLTIAHLMALEEIDPLTIAIHTDWSGSVWVVLEAISWQVFNRLVKSSSKLLLLLLLSRLASLRHLSLNITNPKSRNRSAYHHTLTFTITFIIYLIKSIHLYGLSVTR